MLSKNKTRSEQLASLAFHWKMEFLEKDDTKLLPMLEHFKLFNRGGAKKLENIMFEMDEWMEEKIYLFDYRYTVSTGKSSHTFKQNVFFVSSKHLGIPAFRMQPENLLHKIGSLLGMQDIDFETHPIFSKQYLLQAEEEDIVRSFFGENLLHFFSDKKSWHVEAVGYYFILYFQNKQLLPSELANLKQTGMSLLKMFKDNTFDITLVTVPEE
jgi:hypothetical protein